MLRARLRFRSVAALAAATVVAGLCVAFASSSGAATGDGTPTDPNISFVGRWDTSNAGAYVPNWAGAYLTTGFTGTTVKLKQRNTIDLYYSIDGAAFTLRSGVSGTVNLTTTPLRSGNHTLVVSYRIVAGSYNGDAVFQGLVLDSGAKTLATTVPAGLVEFVGDSITVGQTSSQVALTSYSWLIGAQLGVRHTQIAQGGACLRDLTAAQSTRGIACVGLEKRFTKIGAKDGAAEWNFARYRADEVVINLGTNDTSHGVSAADFQTGYLNLLTTVRAKYPNAAILALRTFIGRYAAQTRAAVQARNTAGDRNVFYVDTTGWVNSTLLNDSVHPNDAGHRAIAAKLAPIVSAHLVSTSAATLTPTTSAPTTPDPTTPAPTTPDPTTPAPTTPSPTVPSGSRCSAAFAVDSSWPGGFVAGVTVAAASSLTGWKVTLALPSGTAISTIWGGTTSATAGTVTVANASYNGSLGPGRSTSFGFQATGSGTGVTATCSAA